MVAKPQEISPCGPANPSLRSESLSPLSPLTLHLLPPPPTSSPLLSVVLVNGRPPEGRETCFKYQLVIFGLALIKVDLVDSDWGSHVVPRSLSEVR